jgi:ferredoxin
MITVDKNLCPQDHVCPMIRMCPQKAISQQGVGLPIIDKNKCVECMICVTRCPRRAFIKK